MDASAALAYFQQEKGQDRVEAALDEGPCWMSAVNLCEVRGKLREKGMPSDDAQAAVDDLRMTVVGFDAESAMDTALLREFTKAIGASLGDRACLALAQQALRNQFTPIVITAEHAWTKLKWPFKIAVIR